MCKALSGKNRFRVITKARQKTSTNDQTFALKNPSLPEMRAPTMKTVRFLSFSAGKPLIFPSVF